MKSAREIFKLLSTSILPHSGELSQTMGQPIMVRETLPRRYARLVGLTVATAVFCGVAWTTVARVSEVAVATGSLLPVGFEQSVQHLEGGIVRSIDVEEGQIVEAGQTIITLKDASTFEDGETMERQKADLLAQLETQKAMAEDRRPDLSFLPSSFVAERQNNLNAYEAERTNVNSQLQEADRQISQARLSYEVAKSELANAEAELDDAEFELDRFNTLLKKGVATKLQVSERSRLVGRARTNVATAASREAAAAERLAEVEQQKASVVARAKSTNSQRILELEGALTALEGNIRKKDGRRERLDVQAPIAGIVKYLAVRGPGEVVTPGEQIAIIVPTTGPLVAQTRVPASQVGYLTEGQKANVKLTAYDFTRFGWLTAQVASISPSAFQEEGRGSYYMVKLRLDGNHLPRLPDAPILPGMELTADIITGDKTVFQYLLTPLQRSFGTAFGER